MSNKKDGDLKETLAQARAIYLAMLHGVITSQQARILTKPLLKKVNTGIKVIAKKYKQKPDYISFGELGRAH